MAGFGERIMKKVREKIGNPVMPSKEYRQIQELENEEKARQEQMRREQEQNQPKPDKTAMLHTMQERGEDYPARWHRG